MRVLVERVEKRVEMDSVFPTPLINTLLFNTLSNTLSNTLLNQELL